MTIISSDISRAANLLEQDELVAIPTETVYGLAANIYSEIAIRKIFSTKGRPMFNPLIVHIASVDEWSNIVTHIPTKASLLADAFWPGPLTIVLPKKDSIPDLVTASKPTVAVRVPNHPVTLELLNAIPFPLAAPSANPFGCISPTTAAHVESYFGDALSMVLEGGSCQRGIESTIIGFDGDEPILYRLGSLSVEDIEEVVGPIVINNHKEVKPDAPGMLSRHYAPDTTTYLEDDVAAVISQYPDKKIGVILWLQKIEDNSNVTQRHLSQSGDMKEAASKLYATMHELDGLNLDIIVAEKFPNHGLGRSINDRLQRATMGK